MRIIPCRAVNVEQPLYDKLRALAIVHKTSTAKVTTSLIKAAIKAEIEFEVMVPTRKVVITAEHMVKIKL